MTVKIPIVTTYNNRGVKQAQKGLSGLNKTILGVSKSLGLAFSAVAVAQFGKASVKAFLEDDKAAKQLTKTLGNLGIAFESPAVADFIAKMEKTTGVADDQLRPAFSALVVATHDATQAQQMLGLALDISAGTGKDLETVTAALQKAYLGNATTLQKLGVGLTKAELTSNDFAKISAKLASIWGGSAAASAETLAGKLEILKRASDNAKETIGKGIVDALAIVGKDTNIQKISDQMQSLADKVANVTVGIAVLTDKLKPLKSIFDLIAKSAENSIGAKVLNFLDRIGQASKDAKQLQNMASQSQFVSLEKLRAMEAADARKLAKQRAAEAAKAKKVAADQLILKKASAKFDLDQIQIAAALKGKITEEERIRLELQMAILQENAGAAEKLQKDLEANQLKTQELAKILATLPKADDPFADWPSIIAKINGLIKDLKLNVTTSQLLSGQGVQLNASGTGVVVTPNSKAQTNQPLMTMPSVTGNAQETPNGNQIINPNAPTGSTFDYLGFYSASNLGNTDNVGSTFDYLGFYGGASQPSSAPVINVNVAGSVLAEQDLADTILQQLYVTQSLGTGLQYNARVAL